MKKFNGYNEAKKQAQFTGSAKLPAGAYVAKVQKVRFEEGQNGNSDRIVLAFDIAEGEHKDFFKNAFDADTREDKKWKGIARIYVPADDGSEKDNWSKKAFARWTNAFEDSNNGYSWDWDEKKWQGLRVGIIFREVGNVIEGKEVTYTEVSAPCSVDQAQKGTFWNGFLDFKAKNGYTGNKSASNSATNDFMNVSDDEEEIPF